MMEVNFDGLVGPSHNFAGLSYGNIASVTHQHQPSNPKKAALQGLEKMYRLYQLGIPQAVLPPHERPNIQILRQLGFKGTHAEIIQKAFKDAPEIFISCCSAAAMWTANAAVATPSSDSADKRLHITPANLTSKFHRSIEAPFTHHLFKTIFDNDHFFSVHSPLPSSPYFSDEGAANHTRFCSDYSNPGLHLFVFGRYGFQPNNLAPLRFPARQTQEAFGAICRMHQINENHIIFAQQNPQAIDAGVFHNDVIAVGNKNLFLYHENAYVNTPAVIELIQEKMAHHFSTSMQFIKVTEEEISLEETVKSYLFNSLLISTPEEKQVLVCPIECEETPAVSNFLRHLVDSNFSPVKETLFFDLRESMQNGGGPACLRLRVVMNPQEIEAVKGNVFMNDDLYLQLKNWIEKHYREKLTLHDLGDPQLHEEVCVALDELSSILQLGNIYYFQR